MGKSKELQLAIQAAKAAGDYLRKETTVQVDSAEGKDIKLSSDKKSEQIIMDILEESNLPILSEEYGLKGKTGTEYWIVDPLDGTVNYYKGFREMACVSIALWREDRPVLGVVYRFMVDELFYGEEGYGAYLNDQPIHTASVREVPKAVIATGFPVNRTYGTESLMRFIRQVQCFKKIRLLGGGSDYECLCSMW